MTPTEVLVLGASQAPHLARIAQIAAPARVTMGTTVAELADAAARAGIVVVGGNYRELFAELWPRMTRVRWVHALQAGLETILFPALVESAVPMTNSRGVFARSLGEFALAGMLHFAKDLSRMRRQQSAREWTPFDVEELHGRTLAIVGYGGIGRATAERARAFGMRIHALRRTAFSDALVDRVYTHAELNALMASADYLLISAPLTDETRGLVSADALRHLKPSAVVVNLGRGPIVDEAELVRLLTENKIRGAVLDVFNEEPLPSAHPFWTLDNVLLSPHTADHTSTWLNEAVDLFEANYARYVAGETLVNIVDKRLGY